MATTYCRSEDFPKTPTTSKAVLKIVQLANDQKSVELRGQARSCLVSLYNCCTAEVTLSQLLLGTNRIIVFVCLSQMTSILSELPKSYSDSARSIIQQHLRRGTSGT